VSSPGSPLQRSRERRVSAYLAMSYVLGRRSTLSPNCYDEAGAAIQLLLAGLNHSERPQRARALAGALAPIVKALDRRRLA
jgi:hypothetical protein